MRENLPKEMDFVHEAGNAARCAEDFVGVRTALYIPRVLSATKRTMVMEYIEGGRLDDLQYLAREGIDRNKVAVELSRIFSRMVYLNGYFHAVRTSADVGGSLAPRTDEVPGPTPRQPPYSTPTQRLAQPL